jgi:hypothetical protein
METVASTRIAFDGRSSTISATLESVQHALDIADDKNVPVYVWTGVDRQNHPLRIVWERWPSGTIYAHDIPVR